MRNYEQFDVDNVLPLEFELDYNQADIKSEHYYYNVKRVEVGY